MPFSRFMEIALYNEPGGYYADGVERVGRSGDFYTSVSAGPLFGRLLAGQFLEMHELLGGPRDFTIVEQGANDGRLLADVLAALDGTALEGCAAVVLEPLEVLRDRQAVALGGRPVEWVESPALLREFRGVHFSNELFDALPFDILRSAGGQWRALYVVESEGGFVFEPGEEVLGAELLPVRPDGFLAEVRPAHQALLRGISEKMASGFLLVVDYGMSRRELLAPHRAEGTFACYSRHRRDAKPLEAPGTKDITAHVDFSGLARAAVGAGFEVRGFTDQHHFLVGASAGLLRDLDGRPPDVESAKLLRSLRTLMHPETMGAQFKALLFAKGVATGPVLSGFQFAREAAYLLDEADDALLSPGCG
jgi:SAM-dependent MidA family methyltransferase